MAQPNPAPAAGANVTVGGNRRSKTVRPQDQVEPATFVTEDGVQSEVQMVRLRSLISRQESAIVFCNNSKSQAKAVWVDFDGNEVAYSVIEPGQKKRYRTYSSHPWIIRNAQTNQRMMLGDSMVLFAAPEELTTSITDAPALDWELKSHRHFSPEFRATTKAVLLAHHRSCTAPPPPSPMRAPIPSELPSFGAASGFGLYRDTGREEGVAAAPAGPDSLPGSASVSRCASSSGLSQMAQLQQQMGALSPSSSCNRVLSPASLRNTMAACCKAMIEVLRVRKPSLDPATAELPAASPRRIAPAMPEAQVDINLFSHLPMGLVLHVISLMAPEDQQQCVTLQPHGCANIKPALLPSDPSTWPAPPSKDPGAAADIAAAAGVAVAANGAIAIVAQAQA